MPSTPFSRGESIWAFPVAGEQPTAAELAKAYTGTLEARENIELVLPAAKQGDIGALATLIPQAAGALGITLPSGLLAALGLGAGAYGAYQALGGGEGGGLFGLNVLGGDEFVLAGVPFGGPGLAEPLVPYKEWHISINGTTLQFYRVSTARGSRMFCYNTKTKKWTTWRPQKMAVIGKNLPRHRTLTLLRRNLRRHTADAKTILRLTAPKALKQPYHGGRRRK
jgi:hypothetical protein